jgi:hypothetical protein
VLQDKVLIRKRVSAVDGVAPGAVQVLEVSTLQHEFRNDAVKVRSSVSKTIFTLKIRLATLLDCSKRRTWQLDNYKPVHKALKFSAVLGVMSLKSSSKILPVAWPLISMSRYTIGRTVGSTSLRNGKK